MANYNHKFIHSYNDLRVLHVIKTYNLITGPSYHNLALFACKLTKKRFSVHASHSVTVKGIPKRNWAQFQSEFQQINWEDILKSDDPNNCCNNLMGTIKNIMEKYTQILKTKPRKELTALVDKGKERSGPKNLPEIKN